MLTIETLEHRFAPAVYYVGIDGNNCNDGLSSESAWATLDRASAQDFEAGDTILFQGDEFFGGRLQLTEEDSGVSLGSWGIGRSELGGLDANDVSNLQIRDLFFIGSGKWNYDDNDSAAGIVINANQPNVLLDGPIIHNVECISYWRYGCVIGGNAEGAGFRNTLITSSSFYDIGHVGLHTYATPWTTPTNEGLVIANCVVHDCATLGIAVSGVNNGLITECEAYDVGYDYPWGTVGGPVGIIVYAANNVTISYCEAYRVSNGTAVFDGEGLGFDIGATNCVAEYNRVHNNEGPGLYIYSGGDAATGNVFRYNFSWNDGYDSGSIGSVAASGFVDGTLFVGNVVVGDSPDFVVGQVTHVPEVVSVNNTWDLGLDLYYAGDEAYNWGGRNEQWFTDVTVTYWYFLLPNNELYAWDGESLPGNLTGTLLNP